MGSPDFKVTSAPQVDGSHSKYHKFPGYPQPLWRDTGIGCAQQAYLLSFLLYSKPLKSCYKPRLCQPLCGTLTPSPRKPQILTLALNMKEDQAEACYLVRKHHSQSRWLLRDRDSGWSPCPTSPRFPLSHWNLAFSHLKLSPLPMVSPRVITHTCCLPGIS